MSSQRYYQVVDDRPPAPPLLVRLAISWLTNALILAIVTGLLSDVTVKNFGSLLLAAAVFGVLNTLLKLDITDAIVSGFHIDGFWTLVWATVIVWLVNLALDFIPGPWQVAGKRGRRNLRRGL
jgi:uncharacterized membrane protein YvlD (DUF360 family)